MKLSLHARQRVVERADGHFREILTKLKSRACVCLPRETNTKRWALVELSSGPVAALYIKPESGPPTTVITVYTLDQYINVKGIPEGYDERFAEVIERDEKRKAKNGS